MKTSNYINMIFMFSGEIHQDSSLCEHVRVRLFLTIAVNEDDSV